MVDVMQLIEDVASCDQQLYFGRLYKFKCSFVLAVADFVPEVQGFLLLFCTPALDLASSFATTLNFTIVWAMLSLVPHKECGMHLVTACNDNHWMLANSLTGEEHHIQRSEDMVNNDIYYKISFTKKSGMGYFMGDTDDKLWVSGMQLKKLALSDEAGRITIQDTSDESENILLMIHRSSGRGNLKH